VASGGALTPADTCSQSNLSFLKLNDEYFGGHFLLKRMEFSSNYVGGTSFSLIYKNVMCPFACEKYMYFFICKDKVEISTCIFFL
jgi:hypothetical protein